MKTYGINPIKTFLCFFCLLLSSIMTAQEGSSVQSLNAGVGLGQELNFGNKTIKFKEVTSDSRCPREVTCIWEGSATVLLQIFEGAKLIEEKEVRIHGGRDSSHFITQEFTIEAIALLPYPDAGTPAENRKYCLELKIAQKPD